MNHVNKTVRIHRHGSLGMFWVIGWLFTIGFLKHGFWTGVLAIFIWPYFLGAHFADQPPSEPGRQTQIEQQR